MAKLTNEQKRLRGTDQPCRMDGEVAMDVIVELPRVRLKGTAKRIFTYTATQLINQKLLEVVGLDLLVAYCREMALYHDLSNEVEKEGYTIEVETKNGLQTQINPKRRIAEGALANAKSLASEFGFTPISRTKIVGMIAPKEKKDDFADFEIIENE